MPVKNRTAFLILLALFAAGLWAIMMSVAQYRRAPLFNIPPANRAPGVPQAVADQRSPILVEEIDIPIHPMIELDFKTREHIFELRQREVERVPEFAPLHYVPTPEVFGQMESERAWWGIEGLYFRAQTEQSNLGVSEQSRLIMNPYLLVGLREWHGFNTNLAPAISEIYYANAVQLRWRRDASQAWVRYDLANHFSFIKSHNFPEEEARTFILLAYNARDVGYEFIQVDSGSLQNVTQTVPSGGPVPILAFIHNGQSCGYPGGCNNASPDQPELRVRINALPAHLAVKLWRQRPDLPTSPADMLFDIEMN